MESDRGVHCANNSPVCNNLIGVVFYLSDSSLYFLGCIPIHQFYHNPTVHMWELMSLGLFFSHALIHLAASAKFWKVGLHMIVQNIKWVLN